MLFMLEEEGPHGYLLEPKCSLELDQRPDFKNHKHMAPVTDWHIGLFNLNTDALETVDSG